MVTRSATATFRRTVIQQAAKESNEPKVRYAAQRTNGGWQIIFEVEDDLNSTDLFVLATLGWRDRMPQCMPLEVRSPAVPKC